MTWYTGDSWKASKAWPTEAKKGKGKGKKLKKQPQPRKILGVVRTANKAPKGLGRHHFNAFGEPYPQALAFSVGPATHLGGTHRDFMGVSSASEVTLISFQPGGGLNQVNWATRANGLWGGAGYSTIASTGIGLVPSASSPDTIMASRGSFRLRNITEAGSVAGSVHVLKVSSGIPNFYNTPSFAADLVELVKEHPRTTSMSGSQLTQSHQWDCIPVSQDQYHKFSSPVASIGAPSAEPGLTTILYVIEHPPTSQIYEYTAAACYYCRYNVAGPLGNLSKSPPTAPLNLINMARDVLEAAGSLGKPVAMEGLKQAGLAVPGILGNMIRQNFGGGAGAAALLL